VSECAGQQGVWVGLGRGAGLSMRSVDRWEAHTETGLAVCACGVGCSAAPVPPPPPGRVAAILTTTVTLNTGLTRLSLPSFDPRTTTTPQHTGRYDEAKQLVNEITALKDFIEKSLSGGSSPLAAATMAAAAAAPARANPFFDAFGSTTLMPPSPTAPSANPQQRRRPGFGAFGGVVGSAPRRRPAKGAEKEKGGLLAPGREGWAGKGKVAGAGDMPMEASRKRHSDITAYGIRVEVFCFFQPAASRPQDNQYQFQCNIRITNTNPGDVQLLSRELKIFKADGSPPEYGPASQQLESQPVVGPGSVYMYMSEFGITCVPEDKKYLGRIEGHFNVAVKDENAVVKVPIAPFWLEIPGDTLVLA
jgi:uncharacterized protein affecting Mg2+/Co2+ transport